MLRRFVLAAAIAAGLSVSAAAPSWAADDFTSAASAVSPVSSVSSVSATCAPGSPCAAALCPPGTVCVPSPKQCFTTPCPQFDCVPVSQVPRVPRVPRVASLVNLLLSLNLRLV
ncbi:hypothetical protein [Microtetraspora sp. NBRC 16547]|uniref:hypothetical protein n=1 Tax=Microtetraspora sp. NBRC 16547 TaxID=3030993 RepID=UPI0024A1082A|nr:hypothetical protein [Microtetraspora sp. NBRC 16547]GLW98428.1 hypothetical protein Misp02_25150 [Microtetraspora sp. NBRC 16547]